MADQDQDTEIVLEKSIAALEKPLKQPNAIHIDVENGLIGHHGVNALAPVAVEAK